MTDSNLGTLRPEVKQLWLEALRSGQYRQGHNFLHIKDPAAGDTLCCLGVLCELAVKAGVVDAEDYAGDVDDDEPENLVAYGHTVTMPPAEVRKWAYDLDYGPTMFTEWSVLTERGDRVGLATLNDDHDATFAEIADRIEAAL